MESVYTEKEVLGDALAAEKASTGVYNTMANECVHADVRDTMLKILAQEHEIQDDVFKMMHKRGMYPTPDAQQQKVQEAKQKFECGVKMI